MSGWLLTPAAMAVLAGLWVRILNRRDLGGRPALSRRAARRAKQTKFRERLSRRELRDWRQIRAMYGQPAYDRTAEFGGVPESDGGES